MAPVPATTPSAAPGLWLKRKTPGPIAVGVTEWVTVHIDKRRHVNKSLAVAPAIVSRVDEKQGIVNVLYPNHLSAFFHRYSPRNRIVFAIETYPMSKVRRFEGSTKELQPLLQQALLRFAELREAARQRQQSIENEACGGLNDGTESGVEADSESEEHEAAPELVARGTESGIEADSETEDQKATSPQLGRDMLNQQRGIEDAKASAKAKVAEVTSVQPSDGIKAKIMDSTMAAKPKFGSLKADIESFTRELSHLLGVASSGSLSKSRVRDSLAKKFPEWDAMLHHLDEMNKLVVAEDAVFRL